MNIVSSAAVVHLLHPVLYSWQKYARKW